VLKTIMAVLNGKNSNVPEKKCRCGEIYIQYTTLQNKCPMCLAKKAKLTREKKERKEHRKAKEKVTRRADWMRDAQAAFNKFIRIRDHDRGCICCNNRKYDGQFHAGHYLSVGSHPELRISLINCHKQKSSCNNHKSGNQINYRRYLVGVIGLESVEWLEGPHDPKKYTIDDLKEIKQGFNQWARELEKQLN